MRIANFLHTDKLSSYATPPNVATSLIISHDNVLINENLDINNISAHDTDLNILTVFGNSINIGNKTNPSSCNIYLYGKVHHVVSTDDDRFFNEVDGFLSQTGI